MAKTPIRRGTIGTWTFDGASQVEADPGNGIFRADNVTPSSATNLYFSTVNGSGAPLSVSIDAVFAKDGFIIIEKATDQRVIQCYQIANPPSDILTSNARIIPVTPISNAGIELSDGDEVIVSYFQNVSLANIGKATLNELSLRIDNADFVDVNPSVGDVPKFKDLGGGVPTYPAADGSLITGVVPQGSGIITRDNAVSVADHSGSDINTGLAYATLICNAGGAATYQNSAAEITYSNSTGRFTVGDAAVYELLFDAIHNFVDATNFSVKVVKNGGGTPVDIIERVYDGDVNDDAAITFAIPIALVPNDTLEIQVKRTGGTASTVMKPVMSVKRLGAAGGTGSHNELGLVQSLFVSVHTPSVSWAKVTAFPTTPDKETEIGVAEWDGANDRVIIHETGVYLATLTGYADVEVHTSTSIGLKLRDELAPADIWVPNALVKDGSFCLQTVVSLTNGQQIAVYSQQDVSGANFTRLQFTLIRLSAMDTGYPPLSELTEEPTPADTDLLLLEKAGLPGTYRKVQKSNIGGTGGGASYVHYSGLISFAANANFHTWVATSKEVDWASNLGHTNPPANPTNWQPASGRLASFPFPSGTGTITGVKWSASPSGNRTGTSSLRLYVYKAVYTDQTVTSPTITLVTSTGDEFPLAGGVDSFVSDARTFSVAFDNDTTGDERTGLILCFAASDAAALIECHFDVTITYQMD